MNAFFHSASIGWDAWSCILAVTAFGYLLVGVEKQITNQMKINRPVPGIEGQPP